MSAPGLPGPALLFCPADRPDRYGKALAAADVVVLDLEDAVPAGRKEEARAALTSVSLDPDRVIVRVNAVSSPEHAADLAALRASGYRMVMLPKAEHAEQVAALDGWRVVALCETPLGVLNAAALAAQPNVVAMMWGAEDLIAAMNGRTSRFPDGRYRLVAQHARSAVLLAATAYGRSAIDAVCTDIGDVDGLAAEAEDAAASGFALKACIHPSQVSVVRAAFRPTETQVVWAARVVAAARDGGVVAVDGQMIDSPLIRQAEAVLAAADITLPSGGQ
ncbi:MAG TPA: CoA ester lyase [Actinocrinis sp.]|nr:CoA ester lyase [Actinocrinis sp.]